MIDRNKPTDEELEKEGIERKGPQPFSPGPPPPPPPPR